MRCGIMLLEGWGARSAGYTSTVTGYKVSFGTKNLLSNIEPELCHQFPAVGTLILWMPKALTDNSYSWTVQNRKWYF